MKSFVSNHKIDTCKKRNKNYVLDNYICMINFKYQMYGNSYVYMIKYLIPPICVYTNRLRFSHDLLNQFLILYCHIVT